VSEFCHAAKRSVRVHYKDGTTEGPLPAKALRSLTVRNPDAREKLERIRVVEYQLPNALLKSFRLVDTPGLGSVYGVDSDNSLAYLGVSGDTTAAEQARLHDTLAKMSRTAADVHAASYDSAV